MKRKCNADTTAETSKCPGLLYPISLLWGACMGAIFYTSGTFPYWYSRGFFERPDRGPFWYAPVVIIDVGAMLVLSAVFFAVALRRVRALSQLRLAYLVAGVLLPSVWLTVGALWGYVISPARYWLSSVALWLIHGVPILMCCAPYGLFSGLVLSKVLSKRFAEGDACRP